MQADSKKTKRGEARNFQVSLLIDDINEAKDLSDALREIGIYAHYYDDLDEFWVAANAQTPDFAVIDVKKMSQGSLLLKNHPKVQNSTLCFAFYYSEATKVLANPAFGFNHYGLIKKELSLLGQLRQALRRRNEELRLIEDNKKQRDRIERLQTRSNRILQDAQETFRFQNQYKKMLEVTSRMGRASSRQDYLNQLMSLFSEWDACKAYGIYTLNKTNQKLTAPKLIKPRYEQLPDLWLTRPGDRGIEAYAQEMGHEVAFDILDDAKAINVYGAFDNPDIMVIASFDRAQVEEFAWELFEERLSYAYARLILKEERQEDTSSRRLSLWEAFSYLDDIHFHQTKSRHQLADVDFSGLLKVINEKSGNRFYWKSFYADFMSELEDALAGDFKIASYGAQSALVFIDKTCLETDYQKLKAMVDDFQYWRYFQDTSMVMTAQMAPEVKLVAPSSLNAIRQMRSNLIAARDGGSQRQSKRFSSRSLEA